MWFPFVLRVKIQKPTLKPNPEHLLSPNYKVPLLPASSPFHKWRPLPRFCTHCLQCSLLRQQQPILQARMKLQYSEREVTGFCYLNSPVMIVCICISISIYLHSVSLSLLDCSCHKERSFLPPPPTNYRIPHTWLSSCLPEML